MKNWKTMAALLLGLGVLGGLATWDEWKTKKEETEKSESNKWTTTKLEDVEAVDYEMAAADEGPDKKPAVSLKIRKKDGKWVIVSPIEWQADQQAVDDLLKAVLDYKYETKVASAKADWGQYGLDNPRRKITLKLKGDKQETYVIGNNAPVGYSTYVASSRSEDVYAGSQYIGASTGKSMHDLRDKKILSLASSDVAGIKIERNKMPTVELSKKDGKYSLVQPQTTEADALAATNLADDLTQLKATEFVDAPPADQQKHFDKKSADAVVTLTDSKGGTQTLIFASLKNGFYLTLNPSKTLFKLADDAKGKVLKTVNDLRNKKIFSFQAAQINEVDVDGKAYQRVKEEWYTKDDAGKFDKDGKFTGKDADKPTSKANIRSLLVDLEFAKADETFPTTSEVAKKLPANPKHKIVLTPASGPKIDIDVWLAGDNPEKVLLKTSGKDQVFKAPRTVISSLSEQTAIMPAGSELENPKG